MTWLKKMIFLFIFWCIRLYRLEGLYKVSRLCPFLIRNHSKPRSQKPLNSKVQNIWIMNSTKLKPWMPQYPFNIKQKPSKSSQSWSWSFIRTGLNVLNLSVGDVSVRITCCQMQGDPREIQLTAEVCEIYSFTRLFSILRPCGLICD